MNFRFGRRLWRETRGNVAVLFALALAGAARRRGPRRGQRRLLQPAQPHAVGRRRDGARRRQGAASLPRQSPEALKSAGRSRAEIDARRERARPAGRISPTFPSISARAGMPCRRSAWRHRAFLPPEIWGENPIVVTAHARTYGQLAALRARPERQRQRRHQGRINGAAVITPPTAPSSRTPPTRRAWSRRTAASLISLFNCSSGGYEGSGFVPTPQTDCPALPDPLESRLPPGGRRLRPPRLQGRRRAPTPSCRGTIAAA